jgi:hypothetical protein
LRLVSPTLDRRRSAVRVLFFACRILPPPILSLPEFVELDFGLADYGFGFLTSPTQPRSVAARSSSSSARLDVAGSRPLRNVKRVPAGCSKEVRIDQREEASHAVAEKCANELRPQRRPRGHELDLDFVNTDSTRSSASGGWQPRLVKHKY